MSRGRRVLVLLGCAIGLGSLAARDMSRREAALRRAVGEPVPVVVAARDLRPGEALRSRSLGVRRVPARYAPRGRYPDPRALVGLRAAAAIEAGSDIQRALIEDPSGPGVAVAPGQRIAQITAIGPPDVVVPGVRVDVVVTRDSGGGVAELALQDAEVLTARPSDPGDGEGDREGESRLELSLRVSARQAVELAQAQDYARRVRVLPRMQGDRHRLRALEVGG